MWEFLDIRAMAIRELSGVDMNAVDRVLLARECKVTEWLLSSYQKIVSQPTILAIEDAARLGLETTLQLLRLREAFFIKNPITHSCYGSERTPISRCSVCGVTQVFSSDMIQRDLKGHDFSEGLRTEFAIELAELGNLSPLSTAA
jgi:hypothetical protein